MKKSSQYIILPNTNTSQNNDIDINNIRTTNVNILLNRVRLDKKNNFKKKIFFTFLMFSVIIIFSFLLI